MNKKIIIAIAVIALVAVGIGGYAYYQYDQEQQRIAEEARQKAIDEAIQEAESQLTQFEATDDRQAKLEILFNTKERISHSSDDFDTDGGVDLGDATTEAWHTTYASMQAWFEEDYENTFNSCSEEDLSEYKYEQVETLNQYVEQLAALKEKIDSEYEEYGTIEEDGKAAWDEKIDTMSKSISDKVEELEKKHQEEEEAKKAEEEAKAAAQAKNGSSGSSSGSNSGGSSSSGGSSGSGGSSSGGGLSSSGGSGNMTHHWQTDSNGNKVEGSDQYSDSDGNVYDGNGNYQYNYDDLDLDKH